MASNITVDTLTKGSTTLNTDEIVDTSSSQICKAWVNFNGTGTVAIRDSYNVASITDNGVGVYTVNYTNAITAGNAVVASTGESNTQGFVRVGGTSTTVASLNTRVSSTASSYDDAKVYVLAFSS